MTYVKFHSVTDAQAIADAVPYADETGLFRAAVLTDIGQVFSTNAEISGSGELYFESDSYRPPKWGKVVAWAVTENPTLLIESKSNTRGE